MNTVDTHKFAARIAFRTAKAHYEYCYDQSTAAYRTAKAVALWHPFARAKATRAFRHASDVSNAAGDRLEEAMSALDKTEGWK